MEHFLKDTDGLLKKCLRPCCLLSKGDDAAASRVLCFRNDHPPELPRGESDDVDGFRPFPDDRIQLGLTQAPDFLFSGSSESAALTTEASSLEWSPENMDFKEDVNHVLDAVSSITSLWLLISWEASTILRSLIKEWISFRKNRVLG